MPYQTSTNNYQTTKFIVTAVGDGPYTTIQAALDAANTEAIATSNPQTVFIRPGVYTENLTLYSSISLRGEVGEGVYIVGVHTPPALGSVIFSHINLRSATDILTTASAGAGAGSLAFDHCTFEITNGYVFDMANWTSELVIVFCDEISTNNGIINNTAGATVQILNSRVGISTNVFTLTGSNVQILNSQIGCPTTIDGAATVTVDLGSKFLNTLTLGGTATTNINNTSFVTGANTAISHGSANPTELSDVTINSSANPCIAGAGAGNLLLGSVTYLDNATLAGTLTVSRATKLDTGVFEGTSGTFTGALTQTAGAVNLGADAAANDINIGTGAAQKVITLGNVTGASQVIMNSGTGGIQLTSTGTGDITLDADDTMLLDSDGVLELNSSAGAISIGNDDIDQAINIGSDGERVVTIGNVTGVTQLVLNSGTGGVQIASTGAGDITLDSDDTLLIDADGVLELNSSAGTISVGNDDIDQPVNIATDGERVVTVGSTNGGASLALQYGTGDMTIASATGTVMSALDTGEITKPLQPAFLAYNSVNDANQTGAGATVTVEFDTEVFDQNADYNNATDTFTAPITGRYGFECQIWVYNVGAASTETNTSFVTSNRTYSVCRKSPIGVKAVGNNFTSNFSMLTDMDAADTAYVQIQNSNEAGNTHGIGGTANMLTYFSGQLRV